MMIRVACAPLLLLVASCGAYPRDTEGTLDAIHERGTVRVGLVTMRDVDKSAAREFIARIARATEAKPVFDSGPTELQLARLHQGAVDLVIGDFASDSPWMTGVTIVEPIVNRPAGDRSLGLSPVAANGENRWIAVLENAVRDMREDAGR